MGNIFLILSRIHICMWIPNEVSENERNVDVDV